MRTSAVGLLASAGAASATGIAKGFNYGSTDKSTGDGKPYRQDDFETLFKRAQNLPGTSGFSSARLYTMIQANTENDPIEAIPAASNTKTTLLLGLWCSGDGFDNELAALGSAIRKYGEEMKELVVGISVGSEDIYRDSEMGQQKNAGLGVDAINIKSYIDRVRDATKGTPLDGVSIGHVDTWTAWTEPANATDINKVIEACDFIGVDTYPYWQSTMPNSISDGRSLFDESIEKTKAAIGGKSIWVTETGWPTEGNKSNLAIASAPNAKIFWDDVGCNELFDKVHTWWYTLDDHLDTPAFGVVDASGTPKFDLSCKNASSSNSKSWSSAYNTTMSNLGSNSTHHTGGGMYPTGTGYASSAAGTGVVQTGSATTVTSGLRSGVFAAALVALTAAFFAL